MTWTRKRSKRKDTVLVLLCFLIAFTSGLTLLQLFTGSGLSTQYMGKTYFSYGQFNEVVSKQFDIYSRDYLEQDYVTSVDNDLQNISLPVFMIGNKSVCGAQVDILVYVQSAWENFLKRRLLRRTWASTKIIQNMKMKTFFIVGRPKDINDQVRINNEQLLHGDLIEGDFIDSYRNITIKSIIALSWVSKFCPHVKYVVKSDDDIFVNVFAVAERLFPRMKHDDKVLACHVKESGTSPIVRDSKSKWYIPPNVFPNMTYFPRFCSGYFVVMSTNTVTTLFAQSKYFPVLEVDDVYLFGQLTQNLSVKFIDIKSNLTLSDEQGVTSYKAGEERFISVGVNSASAMELLWALTLQKHTKINSQS